MKKYNDTSKKEAKNQQFMFNMNKFYGNWVWTAMKSKLTESFP